MFDLRACRVERRVDGNYLVSWLGPDPSQAVAIYMSDCPDRYYSDANLGTPLLRATGLQALVPNPDTSVRHYFYIETEQGEGVILAERQLALEGAHNFRDLGGYETSDGRRLKWGKLYRSSKLSGLTDTDVSYVNRLGVSLVFDLRQLVEQELEPSRLGDHNPSRVASLPVTPGSSSNFIENLYKGIIAVDDSAAIMRNMNRDFVASQTPQYAEMFRLLLTEDQQILIHCASGKDRTGFGAALILDVLGVEQESIVDDYLLTNDYLPLEQEIERLSGELSDHTGAAVSEEILRPLLEVRPEYIAACFEEIKKRYESKEHFFETALDLDPEKISLLRERYLV